MRMSEGPQRKPHYKIFHFATRRHSHQPTSPTLTRTPSARPPSLPAATSPSTLAASPHEDAQSQSPSPSPSRRAMPPPTVSESPPRPAHHPKTAHSEIHFAPRRAPPLQTPR